jgi:peptide/nickel transport system substrate-binding protein
VRPDLATGQPQISDDGLTWTIHLRPGIRYGPPLEGVEVVAEDVIRAIERALTPGIGDDYGFYFRDVVGATEFRDGLRDTVSGLESPDPGTLVIHLTAPASDLTARFALAATAPIPPRPGDPGARFGVATGHDDGYGRFLVATGPYMLEGSAGLDFRQAPEEQQPAFEPGRSLTLVRNPSWDPSTDGLRPAYVDRIEISFGATQPGEVVPIAVHGIDEEVEAGRLDFLFDVNAPHAQVNQFQADPELRSQVHEYPANTVFPIQFRMPVRPLDDIHMRKAILLAADRLGMQRIIEEAGVPGGIPTHVFPASLTGGLLRQDDPYPIHDGDINAARAEMRQSAYDVDMDGKCDRQCGPILFLLPAPTHEATAKGELLQEDLAGLGLEIELVLPEQCESGEFDCSRVAMLFDGWRADFLSAFSPAHVMFDGDGFSAYYSLIGVSSDELVAMGFPSLSLPSADDRIDLCLSLFGSFQTRCWAELDQYLMEHVVPELPWLTPQAFVVTSARVLNFRFDQFTALPALDQIALADAGDV